MFVHRSLNQLQKNTVSAFMEYGQTVGLEPRLECTEYGIAHKPMFTASAYLGSKLICEERATTKKEAKLRASDKAMRILKVRPVEDTSGITRSEDRAIPDKDPVSALMEYAQSIGQRASIESVGQQGPSHCPRFQLYAKIGSREFDMIENSNKKQGRKQAANKALLILQREGKLPKLNRGTMVYKRLEQPKCDICPPGKTMVQVLYEYAQSIHQSCEFIETRPPKGPPHSLTFYMAVRLNEEEFPEVNGKSLKETKTKAAVRALEILHEAGRYTMNSKLQETKDISHSIKTWEDKIAADSCSKYNEVVEKLRVNLSGTKVIAAIVMYAEHNKRTTVISLGSGNRCISGDRLSSVGDVVHDSHAEIIAKRGFRRFLYHVIKNSRRQGCLFQKNSYGKLQLRQNFSFHLYISTAPCGDGAVFTRSEKNQDESNGGPHKPYFYNDKQGYLRTKVEKGEGTIPSDSIEGEQTLDGVRQGGRLRTMSCSDKICLWNVVGLQGALLSLFYEPIYLSSITIGQLYCHGHMSRAMCCRVEKNCSDVSQQLPRNYRVNHPAVGCPTGIGNSRTVDRSTAISINWNMADKEVEITDGTTGYTIEDNKSRLSKSSFLEEFRRIQEDRRRLSYFETKQHSSDYQRAKSTFQRLMLSNGYGCWVKKPTEVEWFS